MPKRVEGDFRCSNNELPNLVGCPEFVGGDFECKFNPILSLEGAPKEVIGNLTLISYLKTGRRFTEEEVRAVCNVKGNVYV
jgi:hypothetical protein